MAIRSEIEKLLASDVTAYRINKDTGVAQTNIKSLRAGITSLDNIPLRNAEKLSAYYKQLKRKGEID